MERRGVVVPCRTLHRFFVERCGFGRTAATVRIADGEPGAECQLDFGYLGMLPDPATLLVAFDRVAGNRGANTPAWTA